MPRGFIDGSLHRPKEEHRSIVLVVGAVLDQALEGAILTKLPGIKPGNENYLFSDDAAPLRDFDAKIRMAFALGLYGEAVRSDLSLIRSIRNTFAHSRLDITFETPEVAQAVKWFTLPSRAPNFVYGGAKESPCQLFIDVSWQYALNLITYEAGVIDHHRALILDIPETPQVQQLAALLALQPENPSPNTPSDPPPSSRNNDQG